MNSQRFAQACAVSAMSAMTAVALFAGPALAQTEAAPAEVAAPAATTAANVIVVRDPASGAFRGATAEEARVLLASPQGAARAASPQTTAPRSHPSGARGARLTDAFMAHAIAVRMPDGRIVEACFHSAEEAGRAHPLVSIMKLPAAAATE